MEASGQTGAKGPPPDRLRTHAIELYCRELCGSDRMAAAAADVIGSISPADAGGGDDQLLRVTRMAAAAHAPRKAGPGGLRGVLAAEHQSECDATPGLLAERSNGELTPARQFKLENHLARCLFCRAAEVREERASRAFSAVLATGDPGPRPPQPSVDPTPPSPPPTPHLSEVPSDAPPARRGFVVYPADRARPAPTEWHSPRAAARPLAVLAAYRPFLITLGLGAVLIVVLALALGGGASGQPAAASLPPPAASSTPPAAVGIAVTRNQNSTAPAHKPAAPATPATPTTTTTTTTSSTPSNSGSTR